MIFPVDEIMPIFLDLLTPALFVGLMCFILKELFESINSFIFLLVLSLESSITKTSKFVFFCILILSNASNI